MSFKRFETGDIVDSLDPISGETALGLGNADTKSGDEDSAVYNAIKNLIYPYNPTVFTDAFSGSISIHSFKREDYLERLDPFKGTFDGIDLTELSNFDYEHTEAGRVLKSGTNWFLPDIGIVIGNPSVTLYSKETLGVKYFFIRGKNNEFNYTQNPTFLDQNGDIKKEFVHTPTTYVTTVGLYNDMNELLAVAKLSQPLPKDFNNEFLIRAKLGF